MVAFWTAVGVMIAGPSRFPEPWYPNGLAISSVRLRRSTSQHHHRMIQIRQHGFADRHQFSLPRDRLHILRGGAGAEGRSRKIAALADLRWRSDRPRIRWESRAAFCAAGTSASTRRSSPPAILSCGMVRACSISNSPLASAPQFRQVRAAAQRLPQIVGDGAHVGAAGAVRAHARTSAPSTSSSSVRRRRPSPAPAPPPRICAPVRRRACPPLSWRKPAAASAGTRRETFPGRRSRSRRRSSCGSTLSRVGCAGAIIGVGGPAEAHHAFVDLVAAGIELRQARGAADHQRQHAGGDGSSVPRWPTLLVPAMRRTLFTTSCEVQPSGLSTTMTPSNGFLTSAEVRRPRHGNVSESEIAVPVEKIQERQNQAPAGPAGSRPAGTAASARPL